MALRNRELHARNDDGMLEELKMEIKLPVISNNVQTVLWYTQMEAMWSFVSLLVYCAVTLLRILESVGFMSISSDDLKHILRLLKVGEDETVVRHCIFFVNLLSQTDSDVDQ